MWKRSEIEQIAEDVGDGDAVYINDSGLADQIENLEIENSNLRSELDSQEMRIDQLESDQAALEAEIYDLR